MAAAATAAATTKPSTVQRLAGVIRRNPIKSLAAAGAIGYAVNRSKHDRMKDSADDDDDMDDFGGFHPAALFGSHSSSKAPSRSKLTKEQVLVLPFYRMTLVEESNKDFATQVQRYLQKRNADHDDGNGRIIMEVQELVDVIHAAAKDPKIVAIYGIFGHGFTFQTGGWAHVEEVKNALKVFKESHRVHKEPNISYQTTPSVGPRPAPKPLFAYADSFSSPVANSGMMEYYLAATSFTHLHLQQHGDVSLFGFHASNLFFKNFLQKYGINVHVWKHGPYKNAVNPLTHTSYTKEHAQNISNVLHQFNTHFCTNISQARHKMQQKQPKKEKQDFWLMVQQAGTFTAGMAQSLGFVDYLPPVDPLEKLIQCNQFKAECDKNSESEDKGSDNEKKKTTTTTTTTTKDTSKSKEQQEELQKQWGHHTDFSKFKATSQVSVQAYANRLARKKARKERNWQLYKRLKDMLEEEDEDVVVGNTKNSYISTKQEDMSKGEDEAKSTNSMTKSISDVLFDEKDKNMLSQAKGMNNEKIAVMKINGAITNETARRVESALQRLKKKQQAKDEGNNEDDIKCLVVRVDSPGGEITSCETISSQFQDLQQSYKMPIVVSFGNVSASGGYYISTHADRIFALPTTITGSIGVFMVKVNLRGLAEQYKIKVDSISTSELAGSFDPFGNPRLPSSVNDNFQAFADRTYKRFLELVSTGRGIPVDKVDDLIAQGRVWTGTQAKEDLLLIDELGGLHRAISYAKRTYTSTGQAEVISWPPKKSFMEQFFQSKSNMSLFFHYLLGMDHGGLDMPATNCNTDNVSPVFPLSLSGMMLAADENTAIQCLLQQEGATKNFFKMNAIPLLHPSFWNP